MFAAGFRKLEPTKPGFQSRDSTPSMESESPPGFEWNRDTPELQHMAMEERERLLKRDPDPIGDELPEGMWGTAPAA